MTQWIAVAVASLGCLALKLAGHLVPARLLEPTRVRRVVETLPVALLSALLTVSSLASGQRLVLDSRAAGLVTAMVLVAVRANFLVVIVAACAVAAGVHALHL